jgi:hypothetical protein
VSGLVPAIHLSWQGEAQKMDARVSPRNRLTPARLFALLQQAWKT